MIQPVVVRRPPHDLRLIAFLGIFVLVAAGYLASMYLSDRDPGRYIATLNALPIPSTWEVARGTARRGDFLPAQASREYLVDADPEGAVIDLRTAMQAAGFEIYIREASSDWCDPHPLDSITVACAQKLIEDCRENGPGGPVSCNVQAFRRFDADPEHLERLFASVQPRGSTVDFGPSASPRYLSDPNRAVVRITADLSYPRYFWSSPTPPPAQDQSSP